jgi:CubicO group peptidase (beta-lactamase class C family)
MKTVYILALAVALTINAKAQTGTPVPELTNFDAAMLNLLNTYDVPGGQLAITRNGKLVYNRGFGYADTASQTLVQPHHVFRLASVSKPITSIAIMKLVENGLVDLNDTVFGPTGILNDAIYQQILDPRVKDITVAQLLRHEGGWDSDVSGDPMFNAFNIATAMGVNSPPDASTVIQYIVANKMLDFTPGTSYKYSNFGYAILGRIVEKLTGASYEDYVRNEILLPLGITDMHIGFNLLSNQLPNEVHYYDYSGAPLANSVYNNATQVPMPYGGFNLEAMDANGGWVASAEDLSKLLVAVDGFPTKPDILNAASIDAMTEPSAFTNYALGWAVNSNNNWWHNGSLPGTTTEIVRTNSQLNWALLLNTRTFNSTALGNAVDALVWDVLPTITAWPTHDLFTATRTITNQIVFNVFPSPSNGTFNLRADEALNWIKVYNALGQLVLTLNDVAAHSTQTVNLCGTAEGVYTVVGSGKSLVLNQRVVIQR